MAEELKAKIQAAGDEVRTLKTAKAAADVLQPALDKLLALKKEYKELTGEDYAAPSQAKPEKKKKEAAEKPPEEKKEGPSKSELKKLERKEKRKAGKAAASGGGEAAEPAPVEGGAKKPSAAAPVAAKAAPAKVSAAKAATSGNAKLYPGANPIVTRTVLAAAHIAKMPLDRGYGVKPSFFGDAPFLELLGGVVVGGEVAVLKAIALSSAPQLKADSARVDDWLEWGHGTLAPLVHPKGDDAPSLIAHVAKLESSLAHTPYLTGDSLTLADLSLANAAKHTLEFFGDHEYPHVRAWVSRVLAHEAFRATEAAANGLFKSTDVEVKVNPEEGLLSTLEAIFTAALHKAFPETGGLGFQTAVVSRCNVAAHGDFTCSSAMAVFKALQGAGNATVKSPRDVANAIIAAIGSDAREVLFQDVTVAGAGYVNVKIKNDFLKGRISAVLTNGCVLPVGEKKKILVDFSSPNIAKEMHVGHLRSTIIGDTICRIFEFMGHEVFRVNHVGDWGTQFGMLIKYLKEEYPDFMTNPPNITDLTSFYKNAKKRFDESDEFKDKARLGVVELQSGDPESRAIWTLLCDISRKEFQKVYDRLDIKLEEYGESYYNSRIPATIEQLKAKGLTVEDGGALLLWCKPKFEIPLFVRKSDGGYGYDSTDLAAILYRFSELKVDTAIYVTDAGQAMHFHMIFEAARMAGWIQEPHHRVEHVGFGVVQGEDGKRFKTRSGDTVRLVDLLDEAVARMTTSLEARVAEGKAGVTAEEVPRAAAALGYGAVKYADLRQHPSTDYQFSYDRMLDTRGDTAIYLIFAYARLSSILRKAKDERGIDVDAIVAQGKVVLEHQAERDVAFELIQFPDVMAAIAKELAPNRLCNYLYNLSGKATDFLEACQVLPNPERLVLVKAITIVMSTCLRLLGITPLEKI